jgi:hypothetical protein
MDEMQGNVKMCMLLCKLVSLQQALKNYAEIFWITLCIGINLIFPPPRDAGMHICAYAYMLRQA